MVWLLRNLVRGNAFALRSYRYYKEGLPIISVRHHSYDPDGKTTVELLNKNAEVLMIDSYSQIGFRLNNGVLVMGPMAIFPRTVLSWNVNDLSEITEDSLLLFCLLEPKIDVLVLGVGGIRESSRLHSNIHSFMAKYHISLEILTTEQACATFNFLNAERRCIAGALIPPITLRPTEEDLAISQKKQKRLFDASNDGIL